MPSRRKSPPTALTKSYGPLTNPFAPYEPFSADYIAHMHASALALLQETGIRVLSAPARTLLQGAGARLVDDMVFIGEDLVAQALTNAPKAFTLKGATPAQDLPIHASSLFFSAGAAAPNAEDAVRGRRPGSIRDFRELIQLVEAFDVLHVAPLLVEPQDVPTALRHLQMTEIKLTYSRKPPSVYARGAAQVRDCFDMIALARGLDRAEFEAEPYTFTVINTNSPRQIDVSMAQGLIDFARAGQMIIVTPFTLMGAMAPITVAGALTLSHAEALAAICIAQLARPGAPILYGTFTSNVSMRSGAPAFGTPEHFRASAGAGQLARHIGLPWRSATGTAANLNDAQGAHETQLALWGCLMGGANVILHAAGWLEGGLCLGYEKLITDTEVLTMVAELCQSVEAEPATLGVDAIQDVNPGGHFFGTAHTLARYRDAFYDPLVFETANFEQWTERGSPDTSARATRIWQGILAKSELPQQNQIQIEKMQDFAARRTAEGGAEPT